MKQKLHFLGSHLLVFLKIINIELPSYNRLWGIYGTHKKENPMNHLPLIELSIISQEFSFVKSRTREFGGLALTANKWPKKYPVQKIIVKCCNDNNKRGTNNNGLMIAKKNLSFNFTFFFQSSGFFRSTNYGHFVTFLHIIQHDFHCVFQSHTV